MDRNAKHTNTQALNVALANARQRLADANAHAVECGEKLSLTPGDPALLESVLAARREIATAQEMVQALEATSDAARAADARAAATERRAQRKLQTTAVKKAYAALKGKAEAVDTLVGQLIAAFEDLDQTQRSAYATAHGYAALVDLTGRERDVLRNNIVRFGRVEMTQLAAQELYRIKNKLRIQQLPTHLVVRDDDTVERKFTWMAGRLADEIIESEAKHES